MNKKIILLGGVVFALMAIIVGASIYGLNQGEVKTSTVHQRTEIKNETTTEKVEKIASKKKEPEILSTMKEKVKLKPHHLYVKSDEQIKKEFQQRRITERQRHRMREIHEMRERRFKEQKFYKIRNKKKEENA